MKMCFSVNLWNWWRFHCFTCKFRRNDSLTPLYGSWNSTVNGLIGNALCFFFFERKTPNAMLNPQNWNKYYAYCCTEKWIDRLLENHFDWHFNSKRVQYNDKNAPLLIVLILFIHLIRLIERSDCEQFKKFYFSYRKPQWSLKTIRYWIKSIDWKI